MSGNQQNLYSANSRWQRFCSRLLPWLFLALSQACYLILPHLGPALEFQLCLKSCNLTSWTTKWHDYVRATTIRGIHILSYCSIKLSWVHLWCIDGVQRCLEGVSLLPNSGPTWNSSWLEFLQVLKLGLKGVWLCSGDQHPPTRCYHISVLWGA